MSFVTAYNTIPEEEEFESLESSIVFNDSAGSSSILNDEEANFFSLMKTNEISNDNDFDRRAEPAMCFHEIAFSNEGISASFFRRLRVHGLAG